MPWSTYLMNKKNGGIIKLVSYRMKFGVETRVDTRTKSMDWRAFLPSLVELRKAPEKKIT